MKTKKEIKQIIADIKQAEEKLNELEKHLRECLVEIINKKKVRKIGPLIGTNINWLYTYVQGGGYQSLERQIRLAIDLMEHI